MSARLEPETVSDGDATSAHPPHAANSADWRVWKQALRVPSFSATLAPIVVGSSYAWTQGAFNPGLVVLMLVAAIACHAGANLANDYHDHRRGVDTAENPGSSTVIQRGVLSAEAVRRGMIVAFAIAIGLGLVIVFLTGPAILYLALACLAVAVLYTGGPVPLGYVALGEVAVFLAMGLAIVVGSFLALTGSITPMVLVIALPNAFLITSLIHVNNLRDVDRDQPAGKRTVAMLLGHDRSVAAYVVLLAAAYLSVGFIVLLTPNFWPILAVAVTMPRAISLARAVRDATTVRAYSLALRGTNRLLTEFGLVMAAGLLAGAALSGQLLVP